MKKVIPSVVKREELFITSKVWCSSQQPDNVEKELDLTLSQLGLDYVDLYRECHALCIVQGRFSQYIAVVHWPVAFVHKALGSDFEPSTDGKVVDLDRSVTLVDTWKAMIKLRETGKVRLCSQICRDSAY